MELIACMEESFGIELQDGEALAIDTVGKAIDVFYTKINARVINKIVERKGFEIKWCLYMVFLVNETKSLIFRHHLYHFVVKFP